MSENHDTFFARVEPRFAPSEARKIELAYALAKYYHRAQVRKDEQNPDGTPLRYFEHVRRVALRALEAAPRVDVVVPALLHDALEDTRLSPEMIEDCFGAEIARTVALLSKIPKEGYRDRLESCADWRVLLVKACDRTDNLLHLGDDRAFCEKQLAETVDQYMFLTSTPRGVPIELQSSYALATWALTRAIEGVQDSLRE